MYKRELDYIHGIQLKKVENDGGNPSFKIR